MIGGQVDTESFLQKQIAEFRHERLTGPLPDLVVHSCGAKLHAVHDLVYFVDNQTDDPCLGPAYHLFNVFQGAIAQPLGVSDFLLCQPLVGPELPP